MSYLALIVADKFIFISSIVCLLLTQGQHKPSHLRNISQTWQRTSEPDLSNIL